MSTSNPSPSTPAGTHAIVFGGSIAGLMSAGMLSRHFERVTLVERDRFPDGPQPRKGVPQALHIHGLLTRGMDILAGILPGIREDLEAAGGEFLDVVGSVASFGAGSWRPRFPSGVKAASMSRLFESPAAMFSPRMVLKVLTVRPEKAAQTPGPQPLAVSSTRAA